MAEVLAESVQIRGSLRVIRYDFVMALFGYFLGYKFRLKAQPMVVANLFLVDNSLIVKRKDKCGIGL
jgi:hypothetical protein